jgi:hypothetical protein
VAVAPDGRPFCAGFGASQAEAVGTAEASPVPPFDTLLSDYKQGWNLYDNSLNKPQTEKPVVSRAERTGLRLSTT